jgi:hypothetical protein
MLNWIRTAVICAVMAWSGGAAALEGSLPTDNTLGLFCTIKMSDDADQQWAKVEVAAAPGTE